MKLLAGLLRLIPLLLLQSPARSFMQRLNSLISHRTTFPRRLERLLSTAKPSQTAAGSFLDSVITPREKDYSAWYNDILVASDMVDHSPVRGCMVIKPWGMGIWDEIHQQLDKRIKKTGTQNAYFPLLIPKSFFAREAKHVDGFAKECAVVTHYRLRVSENGEDLVPDPTAVLDEPLVIRPTSETVIWNMFNSWIHSHRDLPLKINQWANIVRWEMRTRPFLRTSEFLWQEGHTAHASSQEAFAFSQRILDMYAEFCQDVLAIPVVKGEKSPSERFAGAEATLTIEALMQNGWALQSGTSHFLGQNFARAFEVHFQNENNERELVWATSWGVSTRLIGALLMTHSDDKGIVLPPRLSPHQVVLVPILTGKEEKDQKVLGKCHEILRALEEASVRAHLDDRRNLRHGAKYFEWERKGIPLRIDVGLRDLEKNASPMTERVGGEKVSVSLDPAQLIPAVLSSLSSLQTRLLSRAQERLQQRTYRLSDYSEMKRLMADPAHAPGFYLVPWRDNAEAEEFIKTDSKATIRCFPFEHNSSPPDASVRCFYSKEPATHFAIFARAF